MYINTWTECQTEHVVYSSQWCPVTAPEVMGTDRRFPLDIRKHLFVVRVIEHWHRFSGIFIMEILKSGMDMVFDNQLQVALHEKRDWTNDLQRSLSDSIILWYYNFNKQILMTSASPKLTCPTQADFKKDLLPKKEQRNTRGKTGKALISSSLWWLCVI